MANTKVILKKSVTDLGHAGDIVEVKNGYARNYLIPQGLAFAWSKGAAAQAEAMKRARLAKAVATREGAVEAKGIIEGIAVEIPAKVSNPASCSVAFPTTRSPRPSPTRLPWIRAQSPSRRSRLSASSPPPWRSTRRSPRTSS